MTSPATSEDLVVVLEQRLETSALLFQPPQGLLLQQPGDLAHREAACGGGGGMKGPEQRNSVTKERQEVYRCDVHQYINTALQACAEIIFTRHDRGRKKHLCLWTDMYTHIYISTAALNRRFYTDKKHLCHCLSVLVRAVKCAHLKLLQQAVRASSMHFTAASPHRPARERESPASLSHRDGYFGYQRAKKKEAGGY